MDTFFSFTFGAYCSRPDKVCTGACSMHSKGTFYWLDFWTSCSSIGRPKGLWVRGAGSHPAEWLRTWSDMFYMLRNGTNIMLECTEALQDPRWLTNNVQPGNVQKILEFEEPELDLTTWCALNPENEVFRWCILTLIKRSFMNQCNGANGL